MALRTLTTVGLFYFVMCEGPRAWKFIEKSFWLRAQTHMTSQCTWGHATTLHDVGSVLGWLLDAFLWALTISWPWLVCEVALTFIDLTQIAPTWLCICVILLFLVKLTPKSTSKNLAPVQSNPIEMNQSQRYRSLSSIGWIKEMYACIVILSRPYHHCNTSCVTIKFVETFGSFALLYYRWIHLKNYWHGTCCMELAWW